jgi:hypothetical protein
MSLENRLHKLECHKDQGKGVEAVFITFCRASGSEPETIPAAGWRLEPAGPEVWRLPGETDQALEARANALTSRRPRVFMQLLSQPGDLPE